MKNLACLVLLLTLLQTSCTRADDALFVDGAPTLLEPAVDVVSDRILAAKWVNRVLRNPADDGAKTIFDPSIRGKTDQFILKFKKPG